LNTLQKFELEEMEGMELNEETKQRFKVEDKEQLNWALRQISAIESEKKEINKLADTEMDRILQWQKKEVEAIDNRKAFFEGLILQYAMNERTKDPKFKSVSTPYGKIGFKNQHPKWNYDEKKLVAFLNDNELYDFVRTKEEPIKTEIKKKFKFTEDGRVFDMDGQEVDGITVEFQDEKLDIKVSE
jgi:phage host-nuclease inhibitor protein Gam